jgi:2-furoyl-CoA dehydrogenase large subunit
MQDQPSPRGFVGTSVERVEDASLLTGRGRYIDDLPIRKDAAHAAFLRSPHAHAEIRRIDTSKALAHPGVLAILTGAELVQMTSSLVVGVKADVACWPMATDRVRYVGEPVVLVVARTRYIAEDALDLINVTYATLPPVMDPQAALGDDATVIHPSLGSNLINERSFCYGDPDTAFATAAHRISVTTSYPRNSCTPIETYGVIADYDPSEDTYDITANFQGPFSIHAVIARALKVPGNRLRLRTPPESGGSFGVKQGVFPYVVLLGVAARVAGRQVKWIEDRLEHLSASVSATNRVTTLEAAVQTDGRVLALSWDQLEDCGAHLRAPEPATLYRMHGNMTGAYAIENVAIRNRVVLTNKTPTGLNRGFGGPQMYFPLERLMHKIADTLGLDRLDVIRRNLVPADAFPYRTATGALLDSGDYAAAVDSAIREGDLSDLLSRRDAARAEGRLYGIGLTAAIEPSVSNMGYISTVLTPAQRAKAGPKNGAQAVATVAIDPLGSVSVKVASVPQGQGHRTVLAQVVADVFGLPLAAVKVNTELDTSTDAWSIASGNYASRFAPAVAGTAKLAAERLRDKLAVIAAGQMNVTADQMVFAEGRIFDRNNPDNALSFARVAAVSHWAPGTLPADTGPAIRETLFWSPDELTAPTPQDGINSSLCHGFIFDFCGVEIDRDTGKVRIDKYVTMHDCGTILHPAMVDGQVRGAFNQALGAALYEEYAYGADGSFLTGTLGDYLIPTVMETPDLLILHHQTPSPFTPLGAKGVGEGNCMSTPVCIANAIADATGIDDLTLPLSPSRIADLIHPSEEPSSRPQTAAKSMVPRDGERALTGEGSATVPASREEIWAMLLDPKTLQAIIPGAHRVDKISDTQFRAEVTLGVGPVKGLYHADITLSDMIAPEAVTLSGGTEGALGSGRGQGRITLTQTEGGTLVSYTYQAGIGGKVASVGGRLLDGAARVVIGQFFQSLARYAGRGANGAARGGGILARLRALFGGQP